MSEKLPLHPATDHLITRVAAALREKLAQAERKYGYRDGWLSPNWMDECRAELMRHVAKGDPLDVIAYCAFLWHHGEPTRLVSPGPIPRVLSFDGWLKAGGKHMIAAASEHRGTTAVAEVGYHAGLLAAGAGHAIPNDDDIERVKIDASNRGYATGLNDGRVIGAGAAGVIVTGDRLVSVAFCVFDAFGRLVHAAETRQAANEHINDAINDFQILDAAQWVIREAYTLNDPTPAAASQAGEPESKGVDHS
ncbi:hypothetical protein [Burkholderia gladioli]|uniref:hypothetical protein n=1 Tax=Burkholderia gladioli TaxID=28095 RepID=UPI00163F4C88|nr:hypothetical protein [Burkholderia gladioli]